MFHGHPQPQVDSDSVCDRLQHFLHNDLQPSPFEVRLLERDVAKLFQTDEPQWGWITRSGLAAVLWQPAEVLKSAQDAIKAIGRAPSLLANLAVGMRHVNLLEDAVRLSGAAHEAEPLDFTFLAPLLGDLINLGRVTKASALLEAFVERLGSQAERNPEIQQTQEMLGRILRGLQCAGASEAQLQREIAAALDVLTGERIRYGEVGFSGHMDPEAGSTFLVEVTFFGTLTDALRLGAALAPRLARLEEWNPARLVVDFAHRERENAHVSV